MQDGNIHCHIDNLSRRNGKNGERIAVATAAYNAVERLWSEREQRFVDFGNRADVIFSKILLPDGAPAWAAVRTDLWNHVDQNAKRKDARLAKVIEAAIARDIPAGMRPALLEAFVAPFVAMGCVADIAIHEDGTDHNPHVHILLTTREISADGFGPKITALEQRQFVRRVRKAWADITNRYLEQAGSSLRVDHRSYKARGVEAVPTSHRGPDAMERRLKREHARRVREERTMAEPNDYDRHEYPHLTSRETWPPEPVASPDMTSQERDEHHRYWEDRKLIQMEEQAQVEPEHDNVQPESRRDTPWYREALDNARRDAVQEPESQERQEDPVEAYDRDVLARARSMGHSVRELEVLAAVQHAGPEERAVVADLILQERMRGIREQDRVEKLRNLQPEIRERLEAVAAERGEEDYDRYPVPGPDDELVAPSQLDHVQDRMIEEYDREDHAEPER